MACGDGVYSPREGITHRRDRDEPVIAGKEEIPGT